MAKFRPLLLTAHNKVNVIPFLWHTLFQIHPFGFKTNHGFRISFCITLENWLTEFDNFGVISPLPLIFSL